MNKGGGKEIKATVRYNLDWMNEDMKLLEDRMNTILSKKLRKRWMR